MIIFKRIKGECTVLNLHGDNKISRIQEAINEYEREKVMEFEFWFP